MKIIEKLKELGMKEEDLKVMEESITALIDERVALKEEEIKAKYEKISEEYCTKTVAEKLEEEKKVISEEYETKLKDLENHIVDKLDAFLDSEINENISDEAVSQLAEAQIYSPIINGIKKLYEENGLDLDEQGTNLLKQAKEDLEEKEVLINKLTEEKMEALALAESGAIKARLLEATNGLTEDQKEKVKVMFEGKSFDEVDSKVEAFIDMMIDEEAKAKNSEGKEGEVIKENNDVAASKDQNDDKINAKNKKDSTVDLANKFMF